MENILNNFVHFVFLLIKHLNINLHLHLHQYTFDIFMVEKQIFFFSFPLNLLLHKNKPECFVYKSFPFINSTEVTRFSCNTHFQIKKFHKY